MKAGKKASDYHFSDPAPQKGNPHYPRTVRVSVDAGGPDDKQFQDFTVLSEEEHRERFPEDHAAAVKEHGSLAWEPSAPESEPPAPVAAPAEPRSKLYPRWHKATSGENHLIKTEAEFKERYPEAHAELHAPSNVDTKEEETEKV